MPRLRLSLSSLTAAVALAASGPTLAAQVPDTPMDEAPPELSTRALPGAEDPGFNGGGKLLNGFTTLRGGFATHMAELPNGQMLHVYSLENDVLDGDREQFIVVRRYNEDGSLDRTFGGPGKVNAVIKQNAGGLRSLTPQALLVTPEGRIFIAATGSDPIYTPEQVIRPIIFALTKDGVLDPTFDDNGELYPTTSIAEPSESNVFAKDLAYDANSKKLTLGGTVAPKSGRAFIWTYTFNVGQPDSFKETTLKESGAHLRLDRLVKLANGEMVLAGGITPTSDAGIPRAYLARQLDNGLVVRKAVNAVGFETLLSALRVDGGKVFLGGAAFTSGLNTQGFVARFNLDSLLPDPAFGANGMRFVSKEVRDVAFSQDKQVLVAGTDGTDYMVGRMSYNGQMDPSFDGDGVKTLNFSNVFKEHVIALVVDPKNRINLGGLVRGTNGKDRGGIARLLP
jgi:uncharacterized delta-60 repeat protein